MSVYVPMYDVCLSTEPMPMHIRSLIKRIGDYDCIVINEYLSDAAKKEAFAHEIWHKQHGDLDSEKPVIQLEKENKH